MYNLITKNKGSDQMKNWAIMSLITLIGILAIKLLGVKIYFLLIALITAFSLSDNKFVEKITNKIFS